MSLLSKIRGTAETLFQLSIGGPQIKNNAGSIDARNATDAAYVNVRGLDPLIATDLATKNYADTKAVLPLSTLWFGNGQDGSVVLPVGTTTLNAPMFYNNLTVPAGATLVTNGWPVYVAGTLDITAASVGAIIPATAATMNGGNAAGAGAGAGSTFFSLGTLVSIQGRAGHAGSVGAGAVGLQPTLAYPDALFANGGPAGGSGASGAGTNAGAAGVAALPVGAFKWGRFDFDASVNGFEIFGGIAGSSGSSGGGDGVNSGGGGGGAGSGGCTLQIFANTIAKSAATPAGVIQGFGGNGGSGGTPAAGNTGGGSGAGAGGGSWIMITYQTLTGPVIAGAITANGGAGGAGGNGLGTGAGGAGGTGGSGGQISIQVLATGVLTNTIGAAGAVGSPAIGLVGGAGGAGGACSAAL